MSQEEFQTLLQFYKTLANESRLKILGILATKECSVEELATLLELKEPTVSHHLLKLKTMDLVSMRAQANTHLYSLNSEALYKANKDMFTPEKMANLVNDTVEYEAWEQKILNSFLENERIKEIPASHKKRSVILRWLVGKFALDTRYPEAEVNAIIQQHHPDYATLRREFIINGLMERDAGIYWRIAEDKVSV